jgi:hypothetical protein
MGGKSRKSGGISKKLIDKIKNSEAPKKSCKKQNNEKPKKSLFKENTGTGNQT